MSIDTDWTGQARSLTCQLTHCIVHYPGHNLHQFPRSNHSSNTLSANMQKEKQVNPQNIGSMENSLTVKCKVCGKLISKSNITKHVAIHNGQEKEACNICSKKVTKEHMKRHMKIHNNDNKTPCEICGKPISRDHLVEHIQTHEERHQCIICDQYVGKSKLPTHTKAHEDPIFQQLSTNIPLQNVEKFNFLTNKAKPEEQVKCPMCLCRYAKKNLKRHIYWIHVLCEICNIELTRTSKPKHIFLVHDKDHKVYCWRCIPAKCLRYDMFQKHNKDHHSVTLNIGLLYGEGNNEYLCDYCEEEHKCEKCIMYYNLVLVGITPRLGRSSQCEAPCYWTTLDDLDDHIQNQHPLQPRMWRCTELEETEPEIFQICNKILPTENMLKKHKFVHMPKRETCWGCKLRFQTVEMLDWHATYSPYGICGMQRDAYKKGELNENLKEILREYNGESESETESDAETKFMFEIDSFDNEADKLYWKGKYYEDQESRKETICHKCGAIGECDSSGECKEHGRHVCKNHGCALIH